MITDRSSPPSLGADGGRRSGGLLHIRIVPGEMAGG
jgi:hypothetical protein